MNTSNFDTAAFGLPTDPGPGSGSKPISAPVHWLAAAGICVATAFVLGAQANHTPTAWIVGWAVGGFVCIGLLAVFTLVDSRRRAEPWYSARPFVVHARTALVLLAALAVCLNAWRFADWVSRR